jgi:leader peptidase (prepilin peptidase)/N-methyltransferase
LLILGWVLYGLVWPPIEIRRQIATTKWKYSPNDINISLAYRVMLRTCEYLYCFWFFYFGASIGSFINVVANRTPQGKSIIWRGSHCPFCDRRLTMLDNMPIFGWIALRGRCRSCHLPIAPRYLIMEIVVGSIFTSLALIELMGNGMNLPHRDWKIGSGIVSTVFYPKWDLIGAYIVHASLFAVVVMVIASHMDRLRFPVLPMVVIGAIYIACATYHPIVAPVRWVEPWGPTYPRTMSVPWERLATSLIGLAAGGLMGLGYSALLWQAFFRPIQSADDSSGIARWLYHSLVIFMLTGGLLGWQVVVQVGIVATSLVVLAVRTLSVGDASGLAKDPWMRPQVLALAILTTTLLLHHLCWRLVAFVPFLPFLPIPPVS